MFIEAEKKQLTNNLTWPRFTWFNLRCRLQRRSVRQWSLRVPAVRVTQSLPQFNTVKLCSQWKKP